MKPFRTVQMLMIAGLAAIVLASPCPGQTDEIVPNDLYSRAGEVYDKGQYEEATQLYQELIARGYGNLDVFYNGANAAFREGKVGLAVLMYRRAWYINPRDADVQANLQLALQRTGAVQPKRTIIDYFFQELSHREWSNLFQAAYWIAIVMTAIAIFGPVLRRFAKPVAMVAGFIALIGASGWFYWVQWQQSGEAVVIRGKQTALYEPREASTPFFALPEGSLVFIEDTFDNWAKVRVSKDSGWVPELVITRVFPWKADQID